LQSFLVGGGKGKRLQLGWGASHPPSDYLRIETTNFAVKKNQGGTAMGAAESSGSTASNDSAREGGGGGEPFKIKSPFRNRLIVQSKKKGGKPVP